MASLKDLPYPLRAIRPKLVVKDFCLQDTTQSSISRVFFSINVFPLRRWNVFLDFSNSVCFKGLEALTASMNPVENNGTVGEGMKIAGWNSQNSLEMLH